MSMKKHHRQRQDHPRVARHDGPLSFTVLLVLLLISAASADEPLFTLSGHKGRIIMMLSGARSLWADHATTAAAAAVPPIHALGDRMVKHADSKESPNADKVKDTTKKLRDIGSAWWSYAIDHEGTSAPAIKDLWNYIRVYGYDTDSWGQSFGYYGSGIKARTADKKMPVASTVHLIDGNRLLLYADGTVVSISETEFKKQMESAKLKYKEPIALPKPEK